MVEPVAADESTAGDVGSVHDAQNVWLVVDMGNNRTIVIPLRGKLVVHNSGSGAAAQAAAGEDMPSSSDKGYLTAHLGWLMTVAALFVQMAFQAALQPPTWIPPNWFQMPHHSKSGGADVAPLPAAAATLTEDQVRRARAYFLFNTVNFATALAILIALLTVNTKFSLRFTNRYLPWMFAQLAISSSCTYVFASSYDTHGELLTFCIMVWYAVSTFIYCLVGYLAGSRRDRLLSGGSPQRTRPTREREDLEKRERKNSGDCRLAKLIWIEQSTGAELESKSAAGEKNSDYCFQ
ncbi:hypothetical protein ABZP36_013884 [Zizania latifolia]